MKSNLLGEVKQLNPFIVFIVIYPLAKNDLCFTFQ